jgi:hypothetical protein
MLAKTLFVRATSKRFATQSASMRSPVQKLLAVQRNSMLSMSSRMFTANIASLEKAAQRLNKALDKEIKYENENYSQLEDIETFLNDSGFKFSEDPESITMVLTKQVGDKTVEVHFDARYEFFPSLCG